LWRRGGLGRVHGDDLAAPEEVERAVNGRRRVDTLAVQLPDVVDRVVEVGRALVVDRPHRAVPAHRDVGGWAERELRRQLGEGRLDGVQAHLDAPGLL
jgi:hypothetical protein